MNIVNMTSHPCPGQSKLTKLDELIISYIYITDNWDKIYRDWRETQILYGFFLKYFCWRQVQKKKQEGQVMPKNDPHKKPDNQMKRRDDD